MTSPSRRRMEPIVRERLLETLRDRFAYRLIVMQGGAGFGKSTIVRQALTDNVAEPSGIDVCIECTADDVHVSELGARIRALFGVTHGPLVTATADAQSLADAIALRSPLDVCLIIEDAHLLRGSPSWDLIRALLDRLPPNGHLLLSTRHEADLPVARLVSQGQALLIDESDLAFTSQESAEFARARGLDPSAAPIAWPALAELAAAGSNHRLQRSYLVAEVVATLPLAVRHLLGAVIVAEGADDTIASALMGRPINVADVLRSIPLVHVDDDGWVQPHDLWRQAVADLLSPEERRDAQDVAAITLASRGRLAQAVRLHCASGNWDAAGRVMLAALSSQPPAIANAALQQQLDTVPVDQRTHPGWQLAGALLTYEHSLAAARTALERMADNLHDVPGLSRDEQAAGLVSVLFHLGTVGRRMADEELLVSVADRLGPLAGARHPRAMAVRASVRGFLAQIHGKCAEGLLAFDEVDHGSISVEQSAHVLMMVGNLHLLSARPDTAATRYMTAAAKSNGPVRLLAEELWATAMWAAGSQDEAIEAETRCLETANRLGLVSRAAQFSAMLSSMLAFAGRFEEAKAVFDQLPVESGSHSGDLETSSLSLLTAALLRLHSGDRQAAVQFLLRIPLPDGHLQRAFFMPAATIVALVPERRAAWAAVEAALIQDAVAVGMAAAEGGVASLAQRDPGRAGALLPSILAPVTTRADDAEGAGLMFQLDLLGPVVVRLDGERSVGGAWKRARVRELLAAIALTGPRPRDQLAEMLWPDQGEGVAGRNLRVNLTYLGDAVEPQREKGALTALLCVQGHLLGLSATATRVDLVTFDRHRARARAAEQNNDPAGALDALTDAVALWRGDVAADISAEWLEDIRRQRRAQFVVAAARAGELALSAGDAARALSFADLVIGIDSFHEQAGRLQAACLLASGNRTGAWESICACIARCDEMGIVPEPETMVLATRLNPTGS